MSADSNGVFRPQMQVEELSDTKPKDRTLSWADDRPHRLEHHGLAFAPKRRRTKRAKSYVGERPYEINHRPPDGRVRGLVVKIATVQPPGACQAPDQSIEI